KGSILKSTATEGIAIDASSGRLHLENVGIVGANGQTIGVACGDLTNPECVMLRWHNVHFGNFAVGAFLDNMYEGLYQGLVFRGCGVGLHLKGCNSSVVS